LTLDGEEIRRAYSICSSSGELRIAVKAVKNGVFSQFANTKLKVGQALEVGEPEGNLYLSLKQTDKKIMLLFIWKWDNTGTSIIKSVLTSEPKVFTTSVIKQPEDVIFSKEYTIYNCNM
jgi:ring-1,2-phenylacetyl-CoA epoxidase subunit PaaE